MSTRTPGPWSDEAVTLADSLLRAAGSGLRFYSMEKTRSDILDIAQKACNAHDALSAENARLREALANVEHQLATDSDLDDLVTRPDKYDSLLVIVRAALATKGGAE